MPEAKVISLASVRPPVWYDVAVCHHHDGTIETWVKAVDIEGMESRKSIAIALRSAADSLDQPYDPELHKDEDEG